MQYYSSCNCMYLMNSDRIEDKKKKVQDPKNFLNYDVIGEKKIVNLLVNGDK